VKEVPLTSYSYSIVERAKCDMVYHSAKTTLMPEAGIRVVFAE